MRLFGLNIKLLHCFYLIYYRRTNNRVSDHYNKSVLRDIVVALSIKQRRRGVYLLPLLIPVPLPSILLLDPITLPVHPLSLSFRISPSISFSKKQVSVTCDTRHQLGSSAFVLLASLPASIS